MNKKNQHVVPHPKGWAVKSEGSSTPSSVHRTQANAISEAQKAAQKGKSELFIHNRGGQIRERNSYGNDPHPPKG